VGIDRPGGAVPGVNPRSVFDRLPQTMVEQGRGEVDPFAPSDFAQCGHAQLAPGRLWRASGNASKKVSILFRELVVWEGHVCRQFRMT
jgi:hypothetical protein